MPKFEFIMYYLCDIYYLCEARELICPCLFPLMLKEMNNSIHLYMYENQFISDM